MSIPGFEITRIDSNNAKLAFYVMKPYVSLYDKFTGEGVRIFVDGQKLSGFDEISNWLLKLKPKSEQNSERLLQKIRDGHHHICSREAIKISPEHLIKRSKGPINICRLCHEAYPSKHGDICRQCQGEKITGHL